MDTSFVQEESDLSRPPSLCPIPARPSSLVQFVPGDVVLGNPVKLNLTSKGLVWLSQA